MADLNSTIVRGNLRVTDEITTSSVTSPKVILNDVQHRLSQEDGTTITRYNGSTIAVPNISGKGAALLTDEGGDYGLLYIGSDGALIANSGDIGYVLRVNDKDTETDILQVCQSNGTSAFNSNLNVNGVLDATSIKESGTALSNKYLAQSGGTLTGTLYINRDDYASKPSLLINKSGTVFGIGAHANGGDRIRYGAVSGTEWTTQDSNLQHFFDGTIYENGTALADKYQAKGSYLPTSGGAMTGPISYQGTQATYPMIKWLDNTGDTYGNGISIGGGGAVVIGSGESSDSIVNGAGVTGGTETLYLGSDGDAYLLTNVQSGYSSAKTFTFNASGNLLVPGSISEGGTALSSKYLGISSTAADSSKLNGQSASYYLNYNNLSNTPSSLPANGGNSDTVDNKHASDFVLSNSTITGATKCKITYDSKGLVTGGADLATSDIPDLSATYLPKTGGYINGDVTISNSSLAVDTRDATDNIQILGPNGVGFTVIQVGTGALPAIENIATYKDAGITLTGIATTGALQNTYTLNYPLLTANATIATQEWVEGKGYTTDSVSGSSSGNNWTSITINGTSKNIPAPTTVYNHNIVLTDNGGYKLRMLIVNSSSISFNSFLLVYTYLNQFTSGTYGGSGNVYDAANEYDGVITWWSTGGSGSSRYIRVSYVMPDGYFATKDFTATTVTSVVDTRV